LGQEPLYYDALNTGRLADGIDRTHPPVDRRETTSDGYEYDPRTLRWPRAFSQIPLLPRLIPAEKAFDGVEIEVAGEDGIFTARCSKRNLHDSLPLWDFVLLKSAELMQ
jgi:hypothetical protein